MTAALPNPAHHSGEISMCYRAAPPQSWQSSICQPTPAPNTLHTYAHTQPEILFGSIHPQGHEVQPSCITRTPSTKRSLQELSPPPIFSLPWGAHAQLHSPRRALHPAPGIMERHSLDLSSSQALEFTPITTFPNLISPPHPFMSG